MSEPRLSRRVFLRSGVAGAIASTLRATPPIPRPANSLPRSRSSNRTSPPPADFRDVSRGKPLPHRCPEEKRTQVGLTRETWKLEVISDPENPATLGKQLTKKDGTALDFAGLLKLGEKHAVRFAKVMTCLNIGCPLGMGIWEGVPLREVVWLTQPQAEPPPRLLLRLPQRRPEADVPQLAAGRPRARRLRRPAAGHPVLQAQRRVAERPARRAGAHRRAGGLRLQVDQVADARRAHEPVPRQRHLRHAEQRRR